MIKLAFFLVKYLFSNKYRVIIAFSSKIDYLCFRVIQLCEVWGIRLIDFRNQFVTHPFLSLILQFVNQRDSLNGNNPYYFFRVSLSVIPASGCIRKHIQSKTLIPNADSPPVILPVSPSFPLLQPTVSDRNSPEPQFCFQAPSPKTSRLLQPLLFRVFSSMGEAIACEDKARHDTKNTNNIRRIKR